MQVDRWQDGKVRAATDRQTSKAPAGRGVDAKLKGDDAKPAKAAAGKAGN